MRDGTSGTIGAIGITRLLMALRSCTNLYDPSLLLTGFIGVLQWVSKFLVLLIVL